MRKGVIRKSVGFESRLLGIARTWAYKHKRVNDDGNFIFSDALHGGVYEIEDELKQLREENKTLRSENEIVKSYVGTGEKIRCGCQEGGAIVDVSEKFCIACQLNRERPFCPKIASKPKATIAGRNYRDDTSGSHGT